MLLCITHGCSPFSLLIVETPDLSLRARLRDALKERPAGGKQPAESIPHTSESELWWHTKNTQICFTNILTGGQTSSPARRAVNADRCVSGSPELGFRSALDAVVVVQLRAAVAQVVNLQAVVQEVQVLLGLLALTHGVRVQNLQETSQSGSRNRGPTFYSSCPTNQQKVMVLFSLMSAAKLCLIQLLSTLFLQSSNQNGRLSPGNQCKINISTWSSSRWILKVMKVCWVPTSSLTLNLFRRATNFCLKFGCWVTENRRKVKKTASALQTSAALIPESVRMFGSFSCETS